MEKIFDTCEVECAVSTQNKEKLCKLKGKMAPNDEIQQVAEFFKVMGDYSRIRILTLLFNGELCVCDIAAVLEMSQSAVSHQLKTLKNTRFVKYRRSGKMVVYSIDDEHISDIIKMASMHIKE